jgi:telomere length regulation protein
MMRSGTHLNGVSNRLASSSQRARFLGMVVAEALSSLVDKGDNKMDFKVEDMQTAEAEWYKSLVNVQDTVGSVEVLSRTSLQIVPKPMARSQAAKRPIPLDASRKVISIKEIDDDEESAEETDSDEDDDLVPYGKPDSDAEDSDEDAANVVRNKPTAPVYIRNLITYLRDTENYDRQKLGLSTAASLIRRKADFGTEVSAHAEELATLLVGIQDKYEIEDFQKLRLQGMVAILVALPAKMGQWFARTFFEGDYSVSQRASVLTTLGLGAREIGGFGKEDTGLTKTDKLPNTSFPSKALPPAMHSLYITPSTKAKPNQPTLPFSAISTLTTSLTNALTQPIAASALASTSGPALMNLTPLSTRQITTPRMRPKLTTNTLSPILPTSFFFPLTGRFFIHLRSNPKNIIFTPPLLPLFLKTLALILDSSGPNTPSLPQLTSEFWDLLLTLRTQATTDISILEALLFAFLILLEINGDQRELVQAHGRQLLETQEWVENVFEKLGRATGVSLSGKRGGGSEEEKVRALAASVLVRIRECVEKYQMVLMGDMASFS